MNITRVEDDAIWEGILRAVGAEPRPLREIQGISGVTHRPLALGVDEASSRLVVITDEPTARHAAMMQVDLSATLPNTKVLVMRAISFDLKSVAAQAIQQFGGLGGIVKQLMEVSEEARAAGQQNATPATLNSRISAFQRIADNAELLKRVPLNKVNVVLQIIDQLRLIEVAGAMETLKDEVSKDASVWFDRLRLESLATADLSAQDQNFGVCPLLLPSFSSVEIDTFARVNAREDVQEILKEKRVYQYFYPGADDLALNFVERGVKELPQIADLIDRSPAIGHPHGENEIVGPVRSVLATIDELIARGMMIEGSVGFELGPDGETRRAEVKFKPAEGVATKILNRANINININADAGSAAAIALAKALS